jgi:hypothetical protein
MIADKILDWFQAPMLGLVDRLPAAVNQMPTDAIGQLTGLAAGQTSIVEGGPGVLFNMPLFASMLASWFVIEAAVQVVKTIVWIKKAILF